MSSLIRPVWALAIAGTLGAAGCAGAAPGGTPASGGDDRPVYGGVLNLRLSSDPIDYDPNFEGRTGRGLPHAYNSLLGFREGPDIEYTDMLIRPELAERW